jgi:ribonuclease Z
VSVREIVVLGSSSQVPTRQRNHNGYLLLWDGEGVLFDPGEGTQRQMTIFNVRAHQIHHIAITHFHGDHCLGLPGVLQRISLDGVPHPVHVHYPKSGEVYFERLRRASIFVDKADIRPNPVVEEGLIFETPKWTLHSAKLDHNNVDARGYRLQERPKWRMDPDRLREHGLEGRVIGQLMAQGEIEHDGRTITLDDVGTYTDGQSMAFLLDTRPCPGALELARGVDLMVVESTYLSSETREARAHGHMTADQAGRLAAEAGARRLLLTHFSQRYPMNAPFAREAGRHHDDVHAAIDGMRVSVPKAVRG